MAGIFGGDILRSLAAATPAEQVERIEAFDTYERRLIAHVQGLHAPVAELKPAQPKPLRLKVNPYEGKEGGNFHFWVREVELAMDAALISTERLRVAFALSNLGGRAKTWAYTREATTPGCFTTWTQLCEQLRAVFLLSNYEYYQRSRFLACKQGKRELHEYIQEMRVLAASLVGNPLPEHINVTVFMDGLKVGPSRTQLFRVHANTMEEAIQIALQEEYSHRQARTPTSVWQGHNASSGAVQGAPAAGASTNWVRLYRAPSVATDVETSGTCNVPALREGKGSYLPNLGAREASGRNHDPRARGTGVTSLAPESLGALETRKSSGGLLVVHASSVAGNGDKYADALRESEGRGQGSVRLADDTVINDWGTRDGRQGAYAPAEVLVVADSNEGVATVAVQDGTDQAGNIGPQAAEAAEESAEGVSCVVPRKAEETKKKNEMSLAWVTKFHPPPARPVEKQCHVFDGMSGRQIKAGAVHLEALPELSALLNLEELPMKDVLAAFKAGEIAEMVLLKPGTSPEDLNSSSVMDEDVLEGFTKQRATRMGSEILKNPEAPVYPLVREYSDVVTKHPPSQLPSDRGVRHEIDLVLGTKYCVTRQWPLPRERSEVIDAFFTEKAKSGVLNSATVPTQTPIPRKDVLLNNMSGCTLYSALDLVDGYYQILMRESDIPLTAVSTPSGMLLNLVDSYYQILMQESDIPLTAASTPSGMPWE
ncbi:Gag protein [Phytophthora palmivora]|uniref:Gag protein n=1 Tax=Phytophthora palmivora TaxID=4796 RepID=A0A2P4X3I5_9STRA|nr:Gag protein [Phytophthora palmivora]